MMPGLVLVCIIGGQILAVIKNQTTADAPLLALCALSYLSIVLRAQSFVTRLRHRQ